MDRCLSKRLWPADGLILLRSLAVNLRFRETVRPTVNLGRLPTIDG
jgi:hypothetical protein